MNAEPTEPETSPAEQLLSAVPDLDALFDQIRRRPEEVIPPPLRVRALVGTAEELEREREKLLRFARDAVEKLRQGRARDIVVPLTEEEQHGAQAILTFFTRPALLVHDGVFVEPPPLWAADLERRKRFIERTFKSVGRIEMTGHPCRKLWSGTGWVAADGWIATNRHVAEDFAEPLTAEAGEIRWRMKPGMAARINFGEDWLGTGPPPGDEERTHDVPADTVLRVYPRGRPDLALIPVQRTSRTGAPLPDPLGIEGRGDGIVDGRTVYVVGYPARDERGRELAAMYRLFEGIFDVKRLQPGKVMGLMADIVTLLHDCSTLGGNSGSCVVDLETGRVVGLHFGGLHRHANLAVPLWMLANDPLLREAGVSFHGV
jgi:hypothetical protein